MIYDTGSYLRLSNEDGDKEESNSIESQRRIINDFIERQPDMEIRKEYVDDGYTGTNFSRPAFEEMMNDVRAGVINCIVVKDLSRLGRNYLETGRLIQMTFPDLGIRFVAINDQVDTKNQLQNGFDMMLPIRNIFNESYSQDISRKVQSSFKAMQRAGAFCGSHASYGYRKSPQDKHKLVIDPYAATIVQEIYDLYLSGVGQVAIASKLNEKGIPCPSVYKRQNGENYRNSKRLDSTAYWTYSTIHKMLQNPMYCGTMAQNKSVRRMRGKAKQRPKEEWILIEGTHEPIIEPEKWNRVQELLKQRTRKLDFENNTSVFAGFLKCADCGRAMTKRGVSDKNGQKRYVYTCGSYSRSGRQVCSSHYIRHEVLEKIVLDDLNTVIANVADLKSMVDEQRKKSDSYVQIEERELEMLNVQLQKISRLKREAYIDYKEELLSKQEYLELREEYTKKEIFLKDKISTVEKQQTGGEPKILDSLWIRNLLEKKSIDALDRETIIEFIDMIYIYDKDKDGNQKIRVQYRFSDELKDLFQIVYMEGA